MNLTLLQGSIKRYSMRRYFILPLKQCWNFGMSYSHVVELIFMYDKHLFPSHITVTPSKVWYIWWCVSAGSVSMNNTFSDILYYNVEEISNFSSWLYIWNLSLFWKWGTSFAKRDNCSIGCNVRRKLALFNRTTCMQKITT